MFDDFVRRREREHDWRQLSRGIRVVEESQKTFRGQPSWLTEAIRSRSYAKFDT